MEPLGDIVKENSIALPENLRIRDIREIEEKIVYLTEFRGYSKIELDFSMCKVTCPETICPLVCFCLAQSADGVVFTIKLPIFDRLRRLFTNCGWANLIAPKQFDDCSLEIRANIPLTRFRNQVEQDQIVNLSINKILGAMNFFRREDLRALEWSVNEICDNVLNHSQSEIGGIFQLSFRSQAREVEFIVADAGIGIPNSLRSIHNQDWSDEFALEQSIKQGVTRDPEFGQGNGLFGTYQIAALSGGTFHINSGFSHLVVTRSGEVQVRRDPVAFRGTTIVCAINFTQPALLERALAFKGENYRMIDFVEVNYEIDDKSIVFILKNETDSTGSRRSGFEVRRKLRNLLQINPDMTIICDLSDVSIMSSSFADESFGKLARELGIDVYNTRIVMRSVTETNGILIARAIRQRLQVVNDNTPLDKSLPY